LEFIQDSENNKTKAPKQDSQIGFGYLCLSLKTKEVIRIRKSKKDTLFVLFLLAICSVYLSSIHCVVYLSSIHCVVYLSSIHCVVYLSSIHCVVYLSSIYGFWSPLWSSNSGIDIQNQHNGSKKDRQHNGSKKDRQHNGSKKDRHYIWPIEKVQTMIYKTLHRKLMIEQHEPH
jgi:hypothetical protein